MLRVTPMAGRDQQIFVTIQVNVEKNRAPRPIGSVQPGQLADLGIAPVAPVEKEGVA